MRFSILLLSLFWGLSFVQAQPKPAPKAPTTTAPKKPSGPPPYVLKKEYDSVTAQLKSQVKSLQGTIASMKGSISNKDQQLTDISNQMKQVEEVLNSTNFKINLTSDSLDKTRTSIEEVQVNLNNEVNDLKTQISTLRNQLYMVAGLALISLLFGISIIVVLSRKLKDARQEAAAKVDNLLSKLAAHSSAAEEQFRSMDQKLSAELRSANYYTDRQSTALREGMQRTEGNLNDLKGSIEELNNRINELGTK